MAVSGNKKHRIDAIGEQGIVIQGETVQPPKIKIRTYDNVNRFYITEPELTQIAQELHLPPDIVQQSYFRINNNQGLASGKELEIAIVWQELMDPEWQDSFLNWLSGQGPLPETITIVSPSQPNWVGLEDAQWKAAFRQLAKTSKTLPGLPWSALNARDLSFPGIDPTCGYKEAVRKKEAKLPQGQMHFSAFGSALYAQFDTKEYGNSLFTLSLDKVEARGGKLTLEEDYLKAKMSELITSANKGEAYKFCLRARKHSIISLGSIQGLQINIMGSRLYDLQFEEGRLYYFTATRIEKDTLEIRCYLDAARESLHGWLKTGLNMGGFSYESLTLIREN